MVDERLGELSSLESYIHILHVYSLTQLLDILNLWLQVFNRYHIFRLEIRFWYHNYFLHLLFNSFT